MASKQDSALEAVRLLREEISSFNKEMDVFLITEVVALDRLSGKL